MKVALVHDWLTGMRGGEKCLEVFCEIFPDAHLYTLLHIKGRMSKTIEDMDIVTSFVQRLPFVSKKYRNYLPLFPTAIEQFDLSNYDLVLSSSHCVAKGVITRPDTLHICYCYTPMRYVWDMYHSYFRPERSGLLSKIVTSVFSTYLRIWDVTSSRRVDIFLGISENVARRIKKHYGRNAEVIFPPVDCLRFSPSQEEDDYYLMVTAFAPYKRVDLAIEAFNRLGLPLKIIGSGQESKKLKKMSASNIEFLGWQPDDVLLEHYSRCKAFVFPGEEDFGITPLEAQSAGRPVIAYGKGGALETIVQFERCQTDESQHGIRNQGGTGLFFYEQSPESLIEAIKDFEKISYAFNKNLIREHALKFDRSVFKRNIKYFVEEKYSEFKELRSA